MNQHHWSQIREDAIEAFGGETPGAKLEQDIVQVFVDDPERVIRSIHRIAALTGVHSRWAVLRSDITRQAQADIVATSTAATQKRIDNARNWIRNAGQHYDLQRHIQAELFGDDKGRGRLTDIHLTDNQRDDLVDLWREVRPIGEQIERELEERLKPRERVKIRTAPVNWPTGDTCQTKTPPATDSHQKSPHNSNKPSTTTPTDTKPARSSNDETSKSSFAGSEISTSSASTAPDPDQDIAW